jgi:hypothetical protein
MFQNLKIIKHESKHWHQPGKSSGGSNGIKQITGGRVCALY